MDADDGGEGWMFKPNEAKLRSTLQLSFLVGNDVNAFLGWFSVPAFFDSVAHGCQFSFLSFFFVLVAAET